jgi:hypothetical protein
MFDLHAVQLAAETTDDPFVGERVAARFACGCCVLWWADWTRGFRVRCAAHRGAA